MSIRRLAVIVALAAPIYLGAQVQRGPLANSRIAGSPVVTLFTPTSDPAAYSAALGSVMRAGVRYGIEGPALDPSVPQFDFAHPPGPGQTLTGLLLGDALDIIGRANPRMRWSEADGMVIVRLTNPNSFLDKRIRRYAVENATPRAALEALIRILAPERVTAGGVDGVNATSAAVDAQMAPRAGRDVTLALENQTVLEVLNRISRENGALSWNIRYDRTPADISTAIFTFSESGRAAIAGPPRPNPSPAPGTGVPTGPPPPDLHRLSINSDMPLALTSYARAVSVPMGIERLPQTPESISARPSTIIDVAAVPPATAIAWIVAYDSRFEWRERSGRFLIRPKPTAGKPSVLDKPLGSFVRDRKPFESVVADWLREIEAETQPPRMDMTRTSLPAGTMDAARRVQISVGLRRATTARDALDAICEAAGMLSWDLREQYSSNPGARTFSLDITSPDGWRYTAPFRITGTALPTTPAPRASIPPEMDRDIGRVSPAATASPVDAFLSVAAAARMPIGIDAGTDVLPSRDPRLTVMGGAQPQPLGPGRLSEILSVVLTRSPGVELTVREGVLTVAPRGSTAQPDHFLNRPIGAFSIVKLPTSKAIALVRMRMNPATREATLADVPAEAGTGRFAAFDRQVTIDLPNPSARDVLNAIVFQNGGVGWTVRYAGADGRPGRAVEEDCVLEMWPMSGSAYMSVQVSRSGTWSEPSRDIRTSITARVPAPPTGQPRAQISLPINSRRLTTELNRWCRSLSMTCTVELVGPPNVGSMGPTGPPTALYDFTGMPAQEALEKLVTFAPDLEWREEGGVYRIRSRALPSTGMALDRVVASVDQKTETLDQVFQFIRSVVSGEKQPQAFILVGPSQSERNKPVTLKLSNVTVRQILDEVSRQYGDSSWSVRYTEANGIYPELMLTISVGNGATGVTMSIK